MVASQVDYRDCGEILVESKKKLDEGKCHGQQLTPQVGLTKDLKVHLHNVRDTTLIGVSKKRWNKWDAL
jgi:hypothetical protein